MHTATPWDLAVDKKQPKEKGRNASTTAGICGDDRLTECIYIGAFTFRWRYLVTHGQHVARLFYRQVHLSVRRALCELCASYPFLMRVHMYVWKR